MFSVAVDGPAGAGKSTISRRVAKILGIVYVDTGALYRAVGLYMLEKGIATKDAPAVTAALKEIEVNLSFKGNEQAVLLNGDDVSQKIRTPEVSMAASDVSAIPEVRAFLFDAQRKIASEKSVIMDGRDIGTVVLPGADVKIFLTASVEERAGRRFRELTEKRISASYDQVLEDIKMRDHNDANRKAAPLRQAEDAVLIDTTGLTFDQSVALMADTVRKGVNIK